MTVELIADLREHVTVCEELLQLLGRENQSLRDPAQPSQFEACQGRRRLLPRLAASLRALRTHGQAWRSLDPLEKQRCPEAAQLIRRAQETIMKALMLDRENEQALLRRGLVPPRHLPPARRQQPHFVVSWCEQNRTSVRAKQDMGVRPKEEFRAQRALGGWLCWA